MLAAVLEHSSAEESLKGTAEASQTPQELRKQVWADRLDRQGLDQIEAVGEAEKTRWVAVATRLV